MVMGEMTQRTDVLVIGGGPGGYAAAFRAADLGLETTLVDTRETPGGVCLHEGCIPSKSLLHVSGLIFDAQRAARMGIGFGTPQVDLEALGKWKDAVVDKLAKGLVSLCRKRGVQYIHGRAAFEGPDVVRLSESDVTHLKFRHAIVATGSSPVPLPGLSFARGSRIMDAAAALGLEEIPETLLVVGGEYIALETAQVYAALGSQVTLAVRGPGFLADVDEDLTPPLLRRMKKICRAVHFDTRVEGTREEDDGVSATLKGPGGEVQERYGRVLVAIGRTPSTKDLDVEKASVRCDAAGFIEVDEQQRTSAGHIFAVGDAAGEPMLAHKAMRQGKVAAEVIAGRASAFDSRAIPRVVYTDPQLAWCGLTEKEAEKDSIPVKVARFPWGASGRAATMGVADGLTKLILDPDTGRIWGAGIAGKAAEALIAECVLAVEMGALAEDLALSIHPHPSLAESEEEAAELFLGGSTHFK